MVIEVWRPLEKAPRTLHRGRMEMVGAQSCALAPDARHGGEMGKLAFRNRLVNPVLPYGMTP